MLSAALLASVLAVDAAEAASAAQAALPSGAMDPTTALIAGITIFMLAVFVGAEIIGKIPPTLHTPLMSGSNAISGITVVGAIVAAGAGASSIAKWLGLLAVILAMINVVGGFLVTHRMLQKFRR
jgi:NAD(P) transhydrogenase subunit alpha